MVDSAGTADYHVGDPPDRRSRAAAARRGYDLSGLRARQDRLRLFLDYAPGCGHQEVPDPYYGGPAGFEQVLDLAEQAAHGLLDALTARRG
jgi:protein-tyrosine phosphatase